MALDDRQGPLDELFAQFLPPEVNGASAGAVVPVALDDRDLLEKAFAARNGADLEGLYRGSWEGRFPSRSEADLALAGRLAFWTGRDEPRMDRLFRSSGLMRGKWDERRGDSTYGADTIAKAAAECRDVYEPHPARAAAGNGDAPRLLQTVRGDRIEMRSIEWVDKPELQGSAFTLVAGPKGVGKGTWIAKKIAATTRGEYGPKRNVLIVSSEDSAAIDLKPRLVAAGADHTRWHLVVEDLALPRDLYRIEDLAAEIGNVGLIVLDPVGNHLGGVDTDKEGLVRFAISGLNRLADELACMIIGVRHLGKSRINGALAAVLGSTAWVDVPRAVLAFARDDEDEMVFHVQVVAGNRSGRSAAQSYRIDLRDVGLKEPVTSVVSLGESLKNVDDLLAGPRRASKSADARSLILDILEAEGEQESDAFDARIARETGLNARTVRNLRGELKNEGLIRAVAEKDEYGFVERWKVVRTGAPRG